jgi:hypothetical protein
MKRKTARGGHNGSENSKPKRPRKNSDLRRQHLQLFEIRDPVLIPKAVQKTIVTNDSIIVVQDNSIICYAIADRTMTWSLPIETIGTGIITDCMPLADDKILFVTDDMHVIVVDAFAAIVIDQFQIKKKGESKHVINAFRNNTLVVCGGNEVVILDYHANDLQIPTEADKNKVHHKIVAHFIVEETILSCALWSKGLITGGEDGYLRFYELDASVPNKKILASDATENAAIHNIHVMSSDSSVALTHSNDGQLKKWDLETDIAIQSVQTEKKLGGHALAVHESKNFLVTGQHGDPTIRFWALDTLEMLFSYRIKSESDDHEKLQHVHSISLSADGSSIGLGTNLDVAFLFKNLRSQ